LVGEGVTRVLEILDLLGLRLGVLIVERELFQDPRGGDDVGRLLLEQIEELLLPREQAKHTGILSRPPVDVNGGPGSVDSLGARWLGWRRWLVSRLARPARYAARGAGCAARGPAIRTGRSARSRAASSTWATGSTSGTGSRDRSCPPSRSLRSPGLRSADERPLRRSGRVPLQPHPQRAGPAGGGDGARAGPRRRRRS